MLSLTVGQRLIGFVRSILFCGVLRDDELGRWSLAYSFLMLAAPLAVVGIPGSFGRYVEYYRSRGQLGLFLRRTVFVSAALVAVTLAMLRVWGPTWAWLVLGDAALAPLMGLLTITLLVVIAFNFATELLTAMRQVRTVSMMRFVSSVLFAVLAIGLLALTSLREEGVIIAFGLSFLIATLLAIGPLRQVQAEAIASSNALPRRDLWGKLLPFATWVWLINLLANLFDAADRFMIVHFAKETAISADSLVGQYHSSRVVPCLLVAVAGIVGGVLLPYMSHDWEAGDHGGRAPAAGVVAQDMRVAVDRWRSNDPDRLTDPVHLDTAREIRSGAGSPAVDADLLCLVQPDHGRSELSLVRREGPNGNTGAVDWPGSQHRLELPAAAAVRLDRCGIGHCHGERHCTCADSVLYAMAGHGD